MDWAVAYELFHPDTCLTALGGLPLRLGEPLLVLRARNKEPQSDQCRPVWPDGDGGHPPHRIIL